METIQVKPPSRNTVMSACLVRFGSSSFERTGIGRTAVAMSVAMLMPALANLSCERVREDFYRLGMGFSNQIGNLGRHLPPLIVGSQKYAIGVHAKTAVMKV